MFRRDCIQAGLSIAALPDGRYVIHRADMPLSNGHATVTVEDSVKARTMRDYERVLLRKKPDGTWEVVARE